MSSGEPKVYLSPCTIIESYNKAIRDVAAGDPSKAKLLKRFVTGIQPEQSEVPLGEATTIFLAIEGHLGNDTNVAAGLIDELIAHTRSRTPAVKFDTPTGRQLTNYGLFGAYRAIVGVKDPRKFDDEIKTIEPDRIPALVWLYELALSTPFEYHLIDPGRYYDHTKEIRQAIIGLYAEPSIRLVLRQATSFSEGLNTLDLTIGAAARSKGGMLTLSPHAAIHEDLPSKFDIAQKFNTQNLKLGERQKTLSTRSTPAQESNVKLQEYTNATKASMRKALRRELTDPRPIGVIAANKIERRADLINNCTARELRNLLDELSEGSMDNPVIQRLGLQKLKGADKHIIVEKLFRMTENADRQAIATPAGNAVYTLCELMDYWPEIHAISEDKRLPAYLILLLVTHLDEKRARTLQLGDGPTDDADETIYFAPHNRLRYNMIGGQVSGDPNLVVEFALSPLLAQRLAAHLNPDGQTFADIAELYNEAKHKLRRTHPGIPRNLSQWSSGGREILGALLTDHELEIVRGTLRSRSKVSSAYIQAQLATLNERIYQAYNSFLKRLSPEAHTQFGWLTSCLQRPKSLPSASIGSTKPAQQVAALNFIESLYAHHSKLRAHLRTLRTLGRVDIQSLLDELNLLCINYWLLTLWVTTGRGHLERMSIIDAEQFLVVEDKDTRIARVPRICGYSDQKYSWLNTWRNQYEIITKALQNLEGFGVPLPINLKSFFDNSSLIPFYVVNNGTETVPSLELVRLTRSRLNSLCDSLDLPAPTFSSNLPRHLWWSQRLAHTHAALIRLQLGQEHSGPGLLDKSSSVSAPVLAQQMANLTPMMDDLALQVKTFSGNAVPSKETTP